MTATAEQEGYYLIEKAALSISENSQCVGWLNVGKVKNYGRPERGGLAVELIRSVLPLGDLVGTKAGHHATFVGSPGHNVAPRLGVGGRLTAESVASQPSRSEMPHRLTGSH